MDFKRFFSYASVIFVIVMVAHPTVANVGSDTQFRRDRRALRARTTATGEDHVAHASIKMRMMNEGRSQLSINPVRAKRFINPASGAKLNKVSEAFKEYAGNRFGPVFPGKERASEMVDQIQHGGYVQPPHSSFPKEAVYDDLLTRQRKDGKHPSEFDSKQSQMQDEVEDFLQYMHEMGILGNDKNDALIGDDQRDPDEAPKPSSAAAYVSHHIHRSTQDDQRTEDPTRARPSSTFGAKAQPHRPSAAGLGRFPRPTHDVNAIKRQSFQSLSNDIDDDDVVDLKDEAIIEIPKEKLKESDVSNHGLANIDLEIIKELLEEILARKSTRPQNM